MARQRGRLRRWFKRHSAALVIAAAILIAAAFVALLWRGAPWLDASRLRGLTPDQRESAIDAIRGRLLQLGAGLVVAVGIVYTGLTFRLNREGHVTERFTKAIDQLGSERLDIRLGAIYALERIMIDSARDHPTLAEVLAAYVREHAPRARNATVESASGDQAQSTSADSSELPTTDVQAALTVLGRRPSGHAERGHLDLRWTKLIGADLTDADLADAYLQDADLSFAHIWGATLTGALLHNANLYAANLNNADLSGAILTGANLTSVILTGANLTSVTLWGANLTHTRLLNANLRDADLSGAILTDTDLANADLTDARMTSAELYRVDLTSADLTRTSLTLAKLRNVRLPAERVWYGTDADPDASSPVPPSS